ncbi:hypothetical protein [Chitinophaga sp.]|uniref:hypothetical protein n=1 Tax=Chitinophaga sp. TaxID=1869181 RepID=UPI002F92B764
MADLISQKISDKAGIPHLVQLLSEQLSSAELSSLLLEVYHQKSMHTSAPALLQQYRHNIYVKPADTDMIVLLEKELQLLRYLKEQGYDPLELSPVAPFGSCSVPGTVNQKKILSAIRHTEVLADATNALALHIAHEHLTNPATPASGRIRYCTVHRHIRAMQLPPGKGYTPHFKIACMVAAGKDTGDYAFERVTFREQLQHIHHLLTSLFEIEDIYFKIQPRAGYKDGQALIAAATADFPFKMVRDPAPAENNYYKGLQFKAIITVAGNEIEIADGGLVDWTHQFTGNKKERCFIAGIGLSLLVKLCPPKMA